MRHGLEISCGGQGVALSTLVQIGVTAERAGWDAIFFEDYLVHYDGEDPPTYDPWVVSAAIASGTETIRLGTTVTGLPRRSVGKLAREVTSLDHLSGGRVTLAVGLGDPADRGTSHMGRTMPIAERAARLDEGLGVLLALLSGEQVDHVGEHYQVRSVRFRPPPVQQPRLPVWVGGSSQAGAVLRRAARADGIVPYKLTDTREWSDYTPDEIAGMAGDIAALRTTATPFDIAIGGRRRRPDEQAERRYLDEIADAGATWWLEFVPPAPADEMIRAIQRGPLR